MTHSLKAPKLLVIGVVVVHHERIGMVVEVIVEHLRLIRLLLHEVHVVVLLHLHHLLLLLVIKVLEHLGIHHHLRLSEVRVVVEVHCHIRLKTGVKLLLGHVVAASWIVPNLIHVVHVGQQQVLLLWLRSLLFLRLTCNQALG